jgi:hypothetical protein
LELQLTKANYDNDQLNKTNENLISDNKFMMEEIGSLKKILKKIDDWKLKIFHLMRDEVIEKEILRNIISDFPNYNEIKENFKFFIKNINEISNINLNNSGNLVKEYMLSSFNNHNHNNNINYHYDNNLKINRGGNFEERYYNSGSSRNNNNINNRINNNNTNYKPEKDFNSIERNFIENVKKININDNFEEKFEQDKSPKRIYLEDNVNFIINF